MDKWNLYTNVLNVQGKTKQERTINQTKREITNKSPKSLAYKNVLIDDIEQNIMIISYSTEINTKKIFSMPNDDLFTGSIVLWNNEHWIITDIDCDNTLYYRGIMHRCNVYLKWQNEKGDIVGRYGYLSDNSKQAEGITHGGDIMDGLDQRFKGYFPLDEETIQIRRDKRFLIDINTFEPNAYIVTNRNVMNYNYIPNTFEDDFQFNGKNHLLQLMFTQTQRNEERDNFDLMIADYFEVEQKEQVLNAHSEILYKGNPVIKCGGSYKTFIAKFFDDNNEEIIDNAKWVVTTIENEEKYFDIIINKNTLKIKALYEENILGSQVKISLSNENGMYSSSIFVKVVSIYE